eukprot:scaffold530_cov193-Alexandrium_tamarense.AAC.21
MPFGNVGNQFGGAGHAGGGRFVLRESGLIDDAGGAAVVVVGDECFLGDKLAKACQLKRRKASGAG